MRVAILGAGAVALGGAALLKTRGHEPVLWSPSGRGTAPLDTAALEASGAIDAIVGVGVARSCREALDGVEAVFIALPANAHRAVMDAAAPELRAGQITIISGHLSFGGLYLSRLLAARGVSVPIVAWGTTVTTGRRTGPTQVRVGNIRDKVDLATVPQTAAATGLDVCGMLFGDRFVQRQDLLGIALSNLNPQNHLAIALCNLTRMERGETWLQYENTTDAVGRLIEALDAERLAIADAFGLSVRSVREHFHLSFGVESAPIGTMARALAARGDKTTAPATLDTRYVLEDAPFGLYPTTLLGRLVGRPAALHEAGLAILSALYGRDLTAENDLLPAIGFPELTRSRLEALARDGWPAMATASR